MAGWYLLKSLRLYCVCFLLEFFRILHFYSTNIPVSTVCHPPRSIRCLRNIIHWNLISAFILRNATWFIVQLTMNPEVHESNVVSEAP